MNLKTTILKLLLLTSLGYVALNLGCWVSPLLAYLQWGGFSSNGEFPTLNFLPPQVCLGLFLRVHREGALVGGGLFAARCFVIEGGFCCLAYVFGRTRYRLVLVPLLYLIAYPFLSIFAIIDGGGSALDASVTWVHVIEGIYFFAGLAGALIFGYQSHFWMADERSSKLPLKHNGIV